MRREERGISEIGDGLYAWLQPPGSWGLNNAGLITSSGESLLVDTLFDTAHTQVMLDAMRRATKDAERINTVVNTHANGDHCWGNSLVRDADIVASRRAALEMEELPPSRMALLMKLAALINALGPMGRGVGTAARALGLRKVANLIEAAPFAAEAFARFDFAGIELIPPTRTFDHELELRVGERQVRLVEVGPAHTTGDVLVELPQEGVVFTGDILFIESHPIVWAGPVSRWVAACDRLLSSSARVIVPGHGPLTDARGVERVREYLVYLEQEAKRRHAAGMDAEAAALDIAFDDFSTWGEAERVAVNVETVYRELEPQRPVPDAVEMFTRMARVARHVRRRARAVST